MKNSMTRISSLLFVFLQVVLGMWTGVFAQHSGWTQYTNGNQINTVVDSGNTVLVGTSGGLVKINKTSTTSTYYNTANSGIANNNVLSIAIDVSGNKWIGTDSGLAKFDGTNWTVYNTSNSNLPDNQIYTIAIDSKGNKWIGTYGGGLAKFNDTN